MAFALVLRLGEVSQALQLSVLRLKMELERRDTYGLAHALMDYAKFVSAENHIVMAIRATEIARDLARVTGDEENLAFSYLRSMENSITTGQWDAAEEAYRVYRDKHSTQGLPDYWLASAEQEHLQALFYQGLDIEIELDRVWDLTVRCRDAWNRRVVQWLQGEVALRKNDLDAAVNHFEQAMEMELNQGILWLGVSLRRIAVVRALQGHTGEARQMIEEVLQREIEDENKPYLDAAEVYLILGEREEASRCALQAYAQAWADGPPFIWWWELERAKQVLSALDIDPPQLPPFDPAKVGPIPLESEIRGLIAELDRKRAGDQGD
jgi:tetratricopeptide (TPR) repeat protein